MAAFQAIRFDDAQVSSAFRLSRARAQDPRPALRSISRAGVNQTRDRFLRGVDPEGRTWKAGRKASGKTLIWKGLLLRSISDRPPTLNSVEWGSNLIYAAPHQFGATITPKTAERLTFQLGDGGWISAKKVTLPARPFLGINSENLAEFAQIYLRYVGGPLTGEVGA